MKKIIDLEYSFPDAENYRRREFKEVFNRNFVVDKYASEILKPEISFLMGRKVQEKQPTLFIWQIIV